MGLLIWFPSGPQDMGARGRWSQEENKGGEGCEGAENTVTNYKHPQNKPSIIRLGKQLTREDLFSFDSSNRSKICERNRVTIDLPNEEEVGLLIFNVPSNIFCYSKLS